MNSIRTLREIGAKLIDEVLFVGLMLTGLVVLCVFKPRYIRLIVRGYIGAVRRKRGRHT